MMIFMTYNVALAIFLVYVCGQFYKSTKAKYLIFMPAAIWFSFPFWGQALERGNSVALVTMIIALAFAWMDDESKVKREVALILIAVAAGIKIYPAILGLLYVKRKDWKKVIRLIIYGVIALFVPFIFFGGMDGFLALSGWLTIRAGTDRIVLCTVRGEILVLLELFMDTTTVTWPHYVAVIGQYLFLILCLGCFFLCKRKWQEALFLCAILVSYLPSGNAYNSVYYLSPLLVFLLENDKSVIDIHRENQNNKGKTILFLVNGLLFSLIFSLPFFFKIVFWNSWMEAGVFFCAYTLLLINFVSVLLRRFR